MLRRAWLGRPDHGSSAKTSIDQRGIALTRKKLIALTIGAIATCATMAIPASAMAATITGAGSTLVAPIEAEWANAWDAKTGNSVTYSAVGSGTGIKDISSRLVDFGASDAPMTPTQAIACHSCWQIPWALSATGVGFNLHGVRKLRLSGPVIAGIYLGQITNWNDSQDRQVEQGRASAQPEDHAGVPQ